MNLCEFVFSVGIKLAWMGDVLNIATNDTDNHGYLFKPRISRITRDYIRLQAALLWETKVSFVVNSEALGWSENRHFHTVSATRI